MQLEKEPIKKDDDVNIIEEFFSKKNSNESNTNTNEESSTLKEEESQIIAEENIIEPPVTSLNKEVEKKVSFLDKVKDKSKKLNMKYIMAGLLVGIITNISVYHYQAMDLQNKSQKFTTGLMYNLSENNNLEQIASNIYLGMKDNGWEPSVKLSNGSVFVFELENGAEFTITKSMDVISTKFHVVVGNFSNAMVKALLIQLEASKIGGTKNFITNKRYDPKSNTISFDIEKIGEGTLSALPSSIYLPPLPNISPNIVPILPPLSKGNVEPKIITIPISPELDKSIINQNKNMEIDPKILMNNEKNQSIEQILKSSSEKKSIK